MTSSTTKTTATRAPRKPADRAKPADQLRAEALAESPAGWELITPVEELRSSQIADAQADLLELFEALGVDLSQPDREFELEMTAATIRKVGELGTVLQRYSVDEEAFIAFDRGKGAAERITQLSMWFLQELGE